MISILFFLRILRQTNSWSVYGAEEKTVMMVTVARVDFLIDGLNAKVRCKFLSYDI